MEGLIYWTLLMVAVVAFTACLALLAVRLRRDRRVLRGEGVTVEAVVAGFAEDPDGSRFPVYRFTGPGGREVVVTGAGRGWLTPRLGATRRLIYLPGAEQEAEEAGWLGPVAIDATVLVVTVLAGWSLWRLLG